MLQCANQSFTSAGHSPSLKYVGVNQRVIPLLSKAVRSASKCVASMPAIFRFGFVGGTGLASDMTAFTLFLHLGVNPFIARIFSLGFATLVTWLLNRQITFERQDRAIGQEAARYVLVTLGAQGISYLAFAGLITMFPQVLPQISMTIGAVVGALFSFKGHKLISFAPVAQRV
jgi:putative flippase GtrA